MGAKLARDSAGSLASLDFPARRRDDVIHFDSRSEAACAVLLEKYCPGWRCMPGATFQIEINGKFIDFRIGRTFLEYHPIEARREFISADAFRTLTDALRPLPRAQKVEVWAAVKTELAAQYWKRRRHVLDSGGFTDCRLIVADSPADLYRRFFSHLPHRTTEAEFCREFRQLLRSV